MSKNPFVGQPAVAAPQDAPAALPPEAVKVSGSKLSPDLSKHRVGASKVYRYWVGVTPDCPQSDVTCAGLSFPKTNDDILSMPGENRSSRVPRIGAITFLDEARFRRLCDELPLMVARFRDGKHEEPGTGQNIGDAFEQPRQGHVFRMADAAHIAGCRAQGMPTSEYTYMAGDVPASRYMFAVLCADQINGSRGETYPETLETAGLVWPEPLTIDDLLA